MIGAPQLGHAFVIDGGMGGERSVCVRNCDTPAGVAYRNLQ